MSNATVRAWWRDVRNPFALFVPLAALFGLTDLDVVIAKRTFFDATHARWIGAHHWWIESLLHTGGRWSVRAVVAIGLALWISTFIKAQWQSYRRPAAYFVVTMVLAIGIVGLLKMITNVDCPWDLTAFGGHFPSVHLFADRPDALRAGRCFPAAHASSGYALVALYFVFRERSRIFACAGLWIGIVCGLVFGLAQQARGAHFVSHDLWSAFLVWLTAASVYAFAFNARLHATSTPTLTHGPDLLATVDWPRTHRHPVVVGASVADSS